MGSSFALQTHTQRSLKMKLKIINKEEVKKDEEETLEIWLEDRGLYC